MPTSEDSVPDPLADPRVFRALQDYQAEVDAGYCPDHAEFVSRYPEVAEALAGCLRGFDFLWAAAPRATHSGTSGATATTLATESRLGDFRILREVGRGGMGVVYEAEQLSLGRRVALKVVSAPALDDRARQRFRNEAHAAASLHHPHIVPVYAVGSEGDSLFLAMQFVEGRSLAALVRRLRHSTGLAAETPAHTAADTRPHTGPPPGAPAEPSEPLPFPAPPAADYYRAVARLAASAADALQHAHDLGIVHRDVKPGNLLVEPGGHLWVADFGLARLPGSGDLTRTGEMLGTLRYMSPEQAAGSAIDHRTDVYSLGATLYELLALRPAFPGSDPHDVLRRVASEEPPTLRSIAPAIPRDLEIIVLKAMAKEPAERYATAREFADDLQRFLDDRPILARRPGLASRARKWARRNRPVVATAAVAAAAAVLAAFGLLLERNARIDRERAATQRALDDTTIQEGIARQEADRARDSMRGMLRALDEVYLRLAESVLPRDPVWQEDDKRLLRQALAFYEEFLRKNADDPVLRREAAAAGLRVANIHGLLGHGPEGLAVTERTLDLCRQLAGESPGDLDLRRQLATAHFAYGAALERSGRKADAAVAYSEALERRRGLVRDFPEHAACRIDLSDSLLALGVREGNQNRPKAACRLLNECLDQIRVVLQKDGDHPGHRWRLASSALRLGFFLSADGRRKEAEQTTRDALATLQKLFDEYPAVPAFRVQLAEAHYFLGQILRSRYQLPEAEKHLRLSLGYYEVLRKIHPNFPKYRFDQVQAHLNLAHSLTTREQHREAETVSAEAVPTARQLVAASPADPSYDLLLVCALTRLGSAQRHLGKTADAEPILREAVERADRLIANHPNNALNRLQVAVCHFEVANVLEHTGREKEAAEEFRNALAHYKELTESPDGSQNHREAHAKCLIDYSQMLIYGGKGKEAESLLTEADTITGRLVADAPGSAAFRDTRAMCFGTTSEMFRLSGRAAEAEAPRRRALEIQGQLQDEFPEVPRYRTTVATSHSLLGTICQSLNRLDDAEKEHRQSVAAIEPLVARYPKVAQYRRQLGGSHNNVALVLIAKKAYREAVPILDKAIAEQEAALTNDPGDQSARQFLANHWHNRALACVMADDHARAAASAEKFLTLSLRQGLPYARVAGLTAMCVPRVNTDANLTTEKRQELTERYAQLALKLLQEAVKKGFRDVKMLKTDSAFQSIRQRTDFQQLLRELEAPKK